MVLTAGAVHQLTLGTAQLYAGGNEDGVNQARNVSAYLQWDQKLGERLNLSGGTRYEHFSINDSTASKPVFRAGLNFQPAEATWLRASVGQGFRFPTIAEKFIRTDSAPSSVPQRRPAPRVGHQHRGRHQARIADRWIPGFLDVAAFYQKYDDFIEFTFGQWGSFTDPLVGLGFRSLNTGISRLWLGILHHGTWNMGRAPLNLLAGYTYTLPQTLTPDYNYNPDSTTVINYLSTSHDTTNYILKYRSQNLVRLDVEWSHKRTYIGLSARYQSQLQNFDEVFLWLESDEADQLVGSFAELPEWGLEGWLNDNPKLPWIWDFRAGYNLSDAHKVSVVVSNLTNAEYSIRPLAIESPRLVNLVYTYEIH